MRDHTSVPNAIRTTFRERVGYSIKAVSTAWLFSGLLIVVAVKGPGVISAWLIWGTPVFLGGWILIAVPCALLGDRVGRANMVAVAGVAGLSGAVLIELPAVATWVLAPGARYDWTTQDLRWPAAAFLIAAAAALLYRHLLRSRIAP